MEDPAHRLLAQILAPWVDHSKILRRLDAHSLKLTEMRKTMATIDELVVRLGAATDEIASDLDTLRAEVANLDPAVAAKFEPLVARLEALGADPTNPVPDQPPAEPVVEG